MLCPKCDKELDLEMNVNTFKDDKKHGVSIYFEFECIHCFDRYRVIKDITLDQEEMKNNFLFYG